MSHLHFRVSMKQLSLSVYIALVVLRFLIGLKTVTLLLFYHSTSSKASFVNISLGLKFSKLYLRESSLPFNMTL